MIKEEEACPIQAEVLAVLANNEDGLNSEELMKQTMGMDIKARSEAVNALLSSGKIEMLPGHTPGAFILRLRKGTQIANATHEEQLIYSLIEESGKKVFGYGIFVIELVYHRRKCAVGTTKKCYILYGVVADESLTGGTFYSDQQLDSQFVETLAHICVAMLQSKRKFSEDNHKNDPAAAREFAFVRSTEVAQFIREKGVCRVQLNITDIESILSIALLDGFVERRADGMYRALMTKMIRCAPSLCPCIHCPIEADCKPGHVISPQNCEYFASWLGW
ncbi:putative DNA-directed RNA polymerase III subunit RPC6 [Dirofilaria immitis]|nr:putative DNA-directed RNA polymerase III subunit RPC6 [Dirofilaria immitis]